jgi:hypothetical protein
MMESTAIKSQSLATGEEGADALTSMTSGAITGRSEIVPDSTSKKALSLQHVVSRSLRERAPWGELRRAMPYPTRPLKDYDSGRLHLGRVRSDDPQVGQWTTESPSMP